MLKDKLVNEIDEAIWSVIEPHHKREAVYVVKNPNDLAQIGALVAEDKTQLVKGFLDAGEMYKPSETEVENWSKDFDKKFKFLIISPYVFIQEKI